MVDWVRPDDWTPGTWSHPAVMDMQARLDPARMTRHADDWHATVDQIRDVLTELGRQVTAQLGEKWRGRGADSALESVQRYVTGSLDGLAACRSAAVHLAELSRAAGDLRACVTAPATEDVAYTAASPGSTLTLQLVGSATQFENLTSFGAINVSNMTLSLPTVA